MLTNVLSFVIIKYLHARLVILFVQAQTFKFKQTTTITKTERELKTMTILEVHQEC